MTGYCKKKNQEPYGTLETNIFFSSREQSLNITNRYMLQVYGSGSCEQQHPSQSIHSLANSSLMLCNVWNGLVTHWNIQDDASGKGFRMGFRSFVAQESRNTMYNEYFFFKKISRYFVLDA